MDARGMLLAIVLGAVYVAWCQVAEEAVVRWLVARRHRRRCLELMGDKDG